MTKKPTSKPPTTKKTTKKPTKAQVEALKKRTATRGARRSKDIPEETKQKVGRLYRAGVFTLKEISEQTGVSVSMMSNWANTYGWNRDFKKQVRDAACSIEAAKIASEFVSQGNPVTDEDAVEAAAQIQVQVGSAHKRELNKQMEGLCLMRDELMLQTHSLYELEKFIHEDTKDDKNPKRRQALLRSIGIGSRVSSMRDLSMAMTTIIKQQRIAYNMDSKAGEDESTYEATLRALYESKS